MVNCTIYQLVRDSQNYADPRKGILYCNDIDNLDECVFMTSTMFRKIWGKTWSSMTQEERILPIVEITYNGQSIYRRYRQISANDFCDYHVGLTRRSIGLLCSDESLINVEDAIQVKVGTPEAFLENHPDHATRYSYKMEVEGNVLSRKANKISEESRIISIVSLILAVVSIILTLL